MMTQDQLNRFKKDAYRIACEHGFHEKRYPDDHYRMLILTEVGEMVNAYRKGKTGDKDALLWTMVDELPDAIWLTNFEKYVKDSVGDEMADVAIRLFDYAGDNKMTPTPIDYVGGDDEDEFFSVMAFRLSQHIAAIHDNYSFSVALSDLQHMADLCKIDLEWHIEQKMRYNEMRPYLHGKKF